MRRTVHFAVSPRLTALLGETYRQTEAALKELVDNSWDADAERLPRPLTSEPIVVCDDGSGMSPDQIEREYLDIARDRRSTKGEYSARLRRRIKGRKGIGKFAGLAAAHNMRVESICNGTKTAVDIDKSVILAAPDDLERVPLPMSESLAPDARNGTTITLTNLDQALNFPSEEKLRTLLLYEYGREGGIKVHVNDRILDVEDLPGETERTSAKLPNAGEVKLRFTLAEGKLPKHPGFLLRVDGKVVGRPQWFGLDENTDIPDSLRKRVYGEIEVEGIEGVVTADWGALVENSKAREEIAKLVSDHATAKLKAVFAREMNLQQARLRQEIARRLQNLPEHRRAFAEAALGRILAKFYGERQDRIDTIASVILDAMERDEYWQVLRNIDEARHGDVANFAEALEQFGLVELTMMAERANGRLRFLSDLDVLTTNPATIESQMHKAIEHSLWILGAPYHLMSSNATLKTIVEEYANKRFKGKRAAHRPDLLLNTDPGNAYLLIEFKRPSHPVSREDETQAQIYADELHLLLPAKPIHLLLVGGRRIAKSNPQNDPPNLRVSSYADIISRARHEVQWLLSNAATTH
jgi:Histidine kinase-, DNA gyrase B-, and HSP90-like ATPase